jgi:NAD(P)-dependent dehydrogenase (short-subunit alcohol dehydrogenase family)
VTEHTRIDPINTTGSGTVLITGGADGLGGAVTSRFLEGGHNVVVTSRPGDSSGTLEVASAHFGDRLHVLPADVTDPDSVARLVDKTVPRLRAPHVLVHLVGGWAGGEALQNTAPETWERMQRLNLYSVFLCSRAGGGNQTPAYGRSEGRRGITCTRS